MRARGSPRRCRSSTCRWSTPTARPRGPRPRSADPLQDREVAVELPGRDLDPVVLPLLALDLDVAVEDVLAERPQHELGLGGQLDRLSERLRKLLDAEAAPLVRAQVGEVLLHRLRAR